MAATINNRIYEQLSDQWRNPDSFLNLLDTVVQPVRAEYLRQCIERQALEKNSKVLDVGCGGGFMSETLAQFGFSVTGVDQSKSTLENAKQHAQQQGLDIDYRHAQAESLPFPDDTYDLVCACDVLEHVGDLERTIKEACRVLKPGGLFFFDTINRTLKSRLAVIDIAQNIPFTAFIPKDVHVWSHFIKPYELIRCFRNNTLMIYDLQGLSPKKNPLQIVYKLLMHKLHKRLYPEIASIMQMKLSNDLSIQYVGYAKKRAWIKLSGG